MTGVWNNILSRMTNQTLHRHLWAGVKGVLREKLTALNKFYTLGRLKIRGYILDSALHTEHWKVHSFSPAAEKPATVSEQFTTLLNYWKVYCLWLQDKCPIQNPRRDGSWALAYLVQTTARFILKQSVRADQMVPWLRGPLLLQRAWVWLSALRLSRWPTTAWNSSFKGPNACGLH